MIINGFSSYYTLVKEQFREYLTLFWNVLAPSIAFAAINFDSISKGVAFPGEAVLPYIGFSILSIALYSHGVLLLIRREEGFFTSITLSKRAVYRYMALQLTAIYTVLIISLLILLGVFGMSIGDISFPEIVLYMARATLAFFVLALLFSAINCLPVNQKSAYSVASFITMFSLLGYYFTQKDGFNPNSFELFAVLLNPLTYTVSVLESGLGNFSQIYSTLTFLVVGIILIKYFRMSPAFRRS